MSLKDPHSDAFESDVENDEVIGQALRRSLLGACIIALFGGGAYFLATAFRQTEAEQTTEVQMPSYRSDLATVQLPNIPLVDITAEAGIDFAHEAGKLGQRLLPETMGGGAAFVDFDSDGDQDILLVNSTYWDWDERAAGDQRPTMHLYSNDGSGHFEDVTTRVGLDDSFYGMGAAAGDYDGDGWIDLYITAVGRNRLYHNIEGERFEEVAATLGVAGGSDDWSCPAMWFDYDRDNRLDLLVGRYVQWDRQKDLQQGFTLDGKQRAYGQPTGFSGTYLALYRNTGDGFEDVSEATGLRIKHPATGVPEAKSLAMALIDANRDGWMDVVVANDTIRNFLLINRDGKRFEEQGYVAGVAVDRNGMATGAMGIDVAFPRNDDDVAIAIGNFANEPSSLYISTGSAMSFTDASAVTGFGPQTKLRLTFGLFFADMDLDGRQDIVCANGHLEEEIAAYQPTQQYAQPPQLFWNAGAAGDTEFVALSAEQTGAAFQEPLVGRGACYADIDSDGDLDVLLTENSGPAKLFRNDVAPQGAWLRLKLTAAGGNTAAIGAIVEVQAGEQMHRRIVSPTKSYLSQCELPVTLAFGEARPENIVVHWPDGSQSEHAIEGLNRVLEIRQPQS